ncbi:ABC transporter permease [Virgibacillus ihumii]|uniref:ABC transporter permease n=1 Tax=Virgibacillus ihumii TaxID=2686091 RepID=UPI00157DEE5D|nr:ABC transporter permease [Virgibacillus ihumii]
MFDSHDFFKKRLSAHFKELSRYTRYILNEHIAFAMFFFVAAMAYYYQQWLKDLPENFPVALIAGVVFGLLVSYSPVRTLLQEPDLVFLIPAETKMDAYFRDAIISSFVVQLYVLLLAGGALGPLYFAAYPDRAGNIYILILAVVLIFKLWNLFTNWWMLKIREPGIRQVDLLARTLLNMAVFYFLVKGEMLLAGITTILFVFVFLYDLMVSRKQTGVLWDLLLEKDQHRMHTFYRMANMFADVPHLKNRVKGRHWLVSMVSRVPFVKKHTFDYLYRITFIRSSDYLGMYLRLIVIGGLFIFFIPNLWMKAIFALLFIYMSSFQMITLYHHHRTVMWLDLYPIPLKVRQQSMIKLLFQLTLLQTIVFTVLLLGMGEWFAALIVIAAGMAFNYIFQNGYVKKKIM